MDPRLNLAAIESRHDEALRRARARSWPDDGRAIRDRTARGRPLHPLAVLGSLMTWR